jgi:hypothetical protein
VQLGAIRGLEFRVLETGIFRPQFVFRQRTWLEYQGVLDGSAAGDPEEKKQGANAANARRSPKDANESPLVYFGVLCHCASLRLRVARLIQRET